MSILGTLIDKTTMSRAGDAGTTSVNVGLTTLAHSLPATFPDTTFVNLRSVQAIALFGQQVPQPFALGANASLQTIGYNYQVPVVAASAISAPTIMFDVIAQVFWSAIR